MDLNKIILSFVLVIFGLFFYNYFHQVINKKYPKFLIDDELKKPQAFHDTPVSTLGGIGILISLTIVYFNFLLFEKIIYFEYLSFCTLFFLLGFLDDLKINIKPKIRLLLMIIFLIILVKFNNFYVEKTGITILNDWLFNSEIFSLIFICLCCLFIINGANLIDGYNGLLGFHTLLIFINLFLINYLNQNNDLTNLLFFVIIVLIVFVSFNFPKAKFFLGDGGSYLVGALIAVVTIKTSIEIPTISPFYFCILLFYLFFEVFFSFFRKLIKEKKSPIHPDKKHLHMLLYYILFKETNDKLKSNYYVSIIINLIYFVLTIPAIFMMKNGIFCKYYSLIFFLTYLISYKKMYAKIK